MPKCQLFQAKCASWFSPSEGSSLFACGMFAPFAVARQIEVGFQVAFPRLVAVGAQCAAQYRDLTAQWGVSRFHGDRTRWKTSVVAWMEPTGPARSGRPDYR